MKHLPFALVLGIIFLFSPSCTSSDDSAPAAAHDSDAGSDSASDASDEVSADASDEDVIELVDALEESDAEDFADADDAEAEASDAAAE